ncbi:MAG: His Kinase (Phospho-acceptor) protein [Chitinophagaceae bacterium]|nr:His Kinase (Phospho-acceptor) protein [Chitinophagaceae bacterium]
MRIKLKTKIWLTVFTIVLLFSFFTLFYFPAQQEKYLLANYSNEVENLAKTVALGVRIANNDENYEGIKEAMRFVTDDHRLKFVSILEDTSYNGTGKQNPKKYAVFKTIPDSVEADTLKYPPGSIIVKSVPFTAKTISGAILLAFSTADINKSKMKIRITSLIVSGAVFFISILIGFWLSRHISIPVLALRDAAHRVGEGDLTQRVKSHSSDEIGELSKAFNKMVEDLGQATQELNKANFNLAHTNKTLYDTVDNLKATQQQLIQAEKMASLGELTAGIAHEINNPINFVSANIQPLKDDMADILKIVADYEKIIKEKKLEKEFEEVRQSNQEAVQKMTIQEIHDLLKGIEEGARRTSEIVRGLRNFSRMDQNVFKKANMNDSLESTLTLLHSTYKNRITVVKDYGNIPDIDCFPGQLNQVFMNILSNAIQAIPQEGRIFIKTWLQGNMVKISMKDTGTGITEDVQNKIFDPFFTTKEVGKGTGLGLSISYGIVEKHNGKIEVFSTPGKGAEFIISIPIQQPLRG